MAILERDSELKGDLDLCSHVFERFTTKDVRKASVNIGKS